MLGVILLIGCTACATPKVQKQLRVPASSSVTPSGKSVVAAGTKHPAQAPRILIQYTENHNYCMPKGK
jgi:hypothetical protein